MDVTKPAEGLKLESCCAKDCGATVTVDGAGNYPQQAITSKVTISASVRYCAGFRVENIPLVETAPGPNQLQLFAPVASTNAPRLQLYRVATVPVAHQQGTTPPEIVVEDADFVTRPGKP